MKYLVTQWIAGLSLPFGPRVQFWLELLAYLFCTLAVVLLIIEERREHIARRERRLSMASPRGSIWIPPEVRSSAARATKLLGLILLGVIIGGLWRDHQLLSATMTFRHVRVLGKISDKRYLMQPSGMKAYDWEFCHDLTMPKEMGRETPAKYVDIKFEQRNGCKQIIGVGFLEISREENNYVETGRNPTTTATTTVF
jgi:hypothetical protein